MRGLSQIHFSLSHLSFSLSLHLSFRLLFHHTLSVISHICVSIPSFNLLAVLYVSPIQTLLSYSSKHTSTPTCTHFIVSDKLLNDTFNQHLLWLTGFPPLVTRSVQSLGIARTIIEMHRRSTSSVSDFIKHASGVALFQERVSLVYLLMRLFLPHQGIL